MIWEGAIGQPGVHEHRAFRGTLHQGTSTTSAEDRALYSTTVERATTQSVTSVFFVNALKQYDCTSCGSSRCWVLDDS